MATTTTTMAMDAMIDSLKLTSYMVSEITSKFDSSSTLTTLPTLQSMVLAPSTLCSTCWSLLNRNVEPSLYSEASASPEAQPSSAATSNELPYHSLDNLANEAIKGCHLCLVVYLGLDPSALKTFARTLIIDSNSTPWKVTRNPKKDPSSSLGFASFTCMPDGSSALSFRFVRSPSEEAKEAKKLSKRQSLSPISPVIPVSPDAIIKSSLVANFDLANFESQRASMGYFFETPSPPTNRSSVTSSTDLYAKYLNQEVSLHVDMTLFDPKKVRELGIRTISEDSVTTASEDVLEIARKWVDDCVKDHTSCNSIIRWKPTYLLDVSIKDGRGNPGVRLVDGALLERSADYVTLSHSWGPARPIRLHKGTAPALWQGVAWSNLPKTLADAVLVTERLGYKYLWIDALCIMHDDEQAVLKEISQMHMVYENAIVNIAATCAWSDSEGFIRPRNVAALQPCVLGVQGHGVDDGTYVAIKSTGWDQLVDKAPLQKRAWALQERVCARRTLHFTRSELLWECRQMCCSEVHPKGIPEHLKYAEKPSLGETESSMPNRFDMRLHHQQAGDWGRLVELYSTGKLSFQTDKLLAMSGLARQYLAANADAGLVESDYVVGLWKPQLPGSLLWTIDKGQRPASFRAPTWSWASTDGAVRFPNADQAAASTQPCIEITDLELIHKYDDVFGLCHGASMRIRGFIARGLLQRRRDYWGETTCSVQFPRARVRVDFDTTTFDQELTKSLSETLEVYILPVMCSTQEVQGLLVVNTGIKGEFERLGTFRLNVDGNKANRDRFKVAMTSDFGITSYEEKIECQDEESVWFAGPHKYVIDLV